jgi:hypothetical protein
MSRWRGGGTSEAGVQSTILSSSDFLHHYQLNPRGSAALKMLWRSKVDFL